VAPRRPFKHATGPPVPRRGALTRAAAHGYRPNVPEAHYAAAPSPQQFRLHRFAARAGAFRDPKAFRSVEVWYWRQDNAPVALLLYDLLLSRHSCWALWQRPECVALRDLWARTPAMPSLTCR
jgi:hypothetical protein